MDQLLKGSVAYLKTPGQSALALSELKVMVVLATEESHNINLISSPKYLEFVFLAFLLSHTL